MLSALMDYLLQQGFRIVAQYPTHVLARTVYEGQEPQIAVVCLYAGSEMASIDAGKMFQQRQEIIKSFAEQGCTMRCRFLSIIVVHDGVTQYLKDISSVLEGVWFVSETGKQLYIFENQSMDYWNLYDIINEFLSEDVAQKYQKQQARQFLNRFQPVTLFLVAVNILVFLLTAVKGNVNSAEYMYEMGAVTSDAVFNGHQYWRLFTCMFLHFGLSHLVNNMVSLVFLGSFLEERIGHFKFALLYVISGLLSSTISAKFELLHRTLKPGSLVVVSAGASGAIFGIIGALICLVVFQKYFNRNQRVYNEISLSSLLFMAFFSLLAGFTTAGVDNAAHVGGMCSGFLLAFLFITQTSHIQITT